jgi:hypothetical protein
MILHLYADAVKHRIVCKERAVLRNIILPFVRTSRLTLKAFHDMYVAVVILIFKLGS